MRLLALVAALAAGCGPLTEERIVIRDSCSACHRPLNADGTASGIEEAHPQVDGRRLGCTECHGGDPDARVMSEAHVAPDGLDSPYLRDLTSGELDEVYLTNPR